MTIPTADLDIPSTPHPAPAPSTPKPAPAPSTPYLAPQGQWFSREEQLSIKPKKKKKKNSKGSPAGSNAGSTGEIENFTLPLDFNVELSDSD